MLNKYILVITLFFISFTLYSEEGTEYSYLNHLYASQPAGWVDRISPSIHREGEPAQENGLFWLLLDEQDNVETGHSYFHIAIKIQNQKGLENFPDLKVYFSPFFQNVIFHQLDVYRDGSNQPLKVLNTANMEAEKAKWADGMNVYSHNIEVTVPIIPLQVGDVVEFSYSLIGTNPVQNGRYSRTFYFEYAYDIDQIFFKAAGIEYRENSVIYPLSRVLPNVQRSDLSWHLGFTEAKKLEDSIPPSTDPYSRVHISDFSSWEDVSLWAFNLFEINAVTLEWLKYSAMEHITTENIEDQIFELVRFVQDEIDFTERESFYAFKPRTATYTLQNGYGDSREKALLLQTLLRSIGVNSDILLVNSDSRKMSIPSPDAFDRACIVIYSGGETYFIDPSLSGQGGSLQSSYWPYYGDILRVGYTQDALIDPPIISHGKVHIKEKLDLSDIDSDFFILNAEYTYYGSEADKIRRELLLVGEESLSRQCFEEYKKRYSEIIDFDNIEISDDRIVNILTIKNRYSVGDIWSIEGDDSIWSPTIYTHDIKLPSFFKGIPEEEFSGVFNWYLGEPIEKDLIFEVILPDGSETIEPVSFQILNDSFDWVWNLEIFDNKLINRQEYTIKNSELTEYPIDSLQNSVFIKSIMATYKENNFTPYIILFSALVVLAIVIILAIRLIVKRTNS